MVNRKKPPARLRELESFFTARPGHVSVFDVAARLRITRRILLEVCGEAIAEGRMTQESFDRMAKKFDDIWSPW